MLTLASCPCQEAVTEVFSRGDSIGNTPGIHWGTVQLMGHVRRGAAAQGDPAEASLSGTTGVGTNRVWRPKHSPHSCQDEAQLTWAGHLLCARCWTRASHTCCLTPSSHRPHWLGPPFNLQTKTMPWVGLTLSKSTSNKTLRKLNHDFHGALNLMSPLRWWEPACDINWCHLSELWVM